MCDSLIKGKTYTIIVPSMVGALTGCVIFLKVFGII